MAKNFLIKTFRISSKMNKLLEEASEGLELPRLNLIRFLLNRSLLQLKADSIRAKGYENLNITINQVTNGNV